jgi:TolB-like protein/Tfp pilus assembly protein PilF
MAVRENDGSWVIHFGEFEADLRAGELRRNGLKVRLQEQPFQILAMLLKRPGEIVTREEVRDRLWPAETFVDFDHGLNSAIQRLRVALRDSAEKPDFVETVARRGYRFIAPVASRVLLASRHEAIDSVAVLPFINATGDPNTEYLSDGITDGLINNLSQISTLRVIARSTVFRYKEKNVDPQEAGHDLNVGAVVSGRVLQRGNSLIIQAELMDVATSSQLWGGQYNRGVEDVFLLQDDLSNKISDKLRLRLTGDEKQGLAKRYTEDAEAYRLYLKGRYHWNKRTPEGVKKAIEYFHQAVDKDPAYSLPYAGLADTYAYLSFFHVVPPREAMQKAKTAATRALEIDENLAEAHVAMGYVSFTYDWDWRAAGRHFERALALNPAYSRAHTFYPFYLSSLGRSEEALAVARSALNLDPASPAVSHSLAVQLYLARKFDEAIDQSHNTQELDANFAVSYASLGEVYVSKLMYREGLLALEKYCALSCNSALSLALLGYSHARSGQKGQALQMIDELTSASKQNFVPAFFFALVYAGLEDKDRAFNWLEKAYEERSNRLAYLKVDALWDPLRSDGRFTDMLRRIGIPQ